MTPLKRFAIVPLIALIATLTACGAPLPDQDATLKSEAVETAQALNDADELKLNQKFKLGNESWSIETGGEEVATIEGVYLKFAGDTLTILSPSKGIVAAEDESILTVSKTAHFYSSDGSKNGKLTKKLLRLLAEYKLEDASGKHKATLTQKLGVLFKGEITAPDGKVLWKFDSALGVRAKITLKRVEEATAVTAEDALLMVVVAYIVNDSN